MQSYPKHKPKVLDERRVGSRGDLYRKNIDGRDPHWEGIDAARKRVHPSVNDRVRNILDGLRERRAVAMGYIHRDADFSVDPQKTQAKITAVRKLIKGSLHKIGEKEMNGFLGELREIEESFGQ